MDLGVEIEKGRKAPKCLLLDRTVSGETVLSKKEHLREMTRVAEMGETGAFSLSMSHSEGRMSGPPDAGSS